MRINEYETIDDFIFEYSQGREFSWQNNEQRERFSGIEFKYDDTYYRMCREPYDENHTHILKNGAPALYDVMILHCSKHGYPLVDKYELVGWYANLDDVLDNCIISNQCFRNIIMHDNTEILSKD